ncbi:MAG: RNA polymerase sigma-70 factor [Prevotellaceae bacterium]|nr:RNA polymerase sigma-70 factor [Prevotellaceae bacterium]
MFRQYYLPLYYFSLSIIQKQDVAEEIVQDLFYYWWKERENIQIHYSIKNYLYKTVQNKSFQHIEHCNVREKYRQYTLSSIQTEQDTPPQEELEQKELQNILTYTLEKLPERRYIIFKMHRYEGKKYKEIAEILSLSIKTVEAEMTKTYKTLREELEKYNRTL